MSEKPLCSREIDLAKLEIKVDGLEKRCDKKDDVLADIKEHVIPDAIRYLSEHTIEPLGKRLRVVEGFNSRAIGWASLFVAVVAFIANKVFS